MRYQNDNSGFTLIELLLYIAIVGSLLVAISMFLAVSVDARVKSQSVSEVNKQGTAATEYITQTIRNANTITAPAAAASGSSLTLTVPASGLNPTVFDLSAGVLRVKEGASAAVPLTNGKVQVTNLTFTNLSRSGTNGIVRISLTVSRINPSGKNEYDYHKTFVTSAVLRQ
jgi:prepilin-type N-terminal cleavage/methylation domain-containing protein